MKRLALVLFLCAFPAFAQSPETFYPATTHARDFASTSRSVTNHMGTQTYVARLVCTADCFVAQGVTPQTAVAVAATGSGVTTNLFLPANTPITIRVSPGEALAVIEAANGSNGFLYVTEMVR